MVPCLVLDVRPGHAVLDMCAAPGSKTAQLLCQLAGQHGAAADFHPARPAAQSPAPPLWGRGASPTRPL